MALTPDQINSAHEKNINPEKMNIIKAGDFSKMKEAAI